MLMSTFQDLHIAEPFISQLAERNITEPSPVQIEAIPAMMEGKDVIAQSQTGTGKTLAYLLPLLQRIDTGKKNPQVLVLAPTQELAMQIVRVAETYGERSGVTVQALIGGAALKRQVEKLKLHPQLAIGTPGRVLELIRMRKLKMHEVRTIVVDEVDQIFRLGAAKDTEEIFKSALRDRQLAFFSATMTGQIRSIAQEWMTEPVTIGIEPDKRIAPTIEHLYFVCEERDKIDTLRRLVRLYEPKSAIVFVNDTDSIAEWTEKLQYVGLTAEPLYGDANKQERAQVLRRFREGQCQLLIATDVAARGLDIEGLPFVFNADPPLDAEHYVHRAGRTGRMGKKGTAVTIITGRERFIIEKFAKQLQIDIREKVMYSGKVHPAGERIRRNQGAGKRQKSKR
ncbi:DEAD/DEAH box helicase [Paenibacillus sp. MSJ-34]|uniref:DEAD/DEAH box helicase n=1 Tax=Paenibacillus sp. MSJ-34 TaxID=2841529 RepID=UPI001C11B5C8|nr:DEAD/DEAH box helicase [Paenibacillus sp. MSJ-34]MBU5440881.1 DEAD/DEAH box helicase [Paenibacillus sp. MSJ-34]